MDNNHAAQHQTPGYFAFAETHGKRLRRIEGQIRGLQRQVLP